MTKINVSIIGASGFTGSELIRVLLAHPQVNLKYLTSRQHEKTPLGIFFPRLEHIQDLYLTNTDYAVVAAESDVVFLCLPHVASQEVVEQFLGKTKIIDMSADFRLDNPAVFEKYYGTVHLKPELLNGDFIYGFPEMNKDALMRADNVANPGCNALLIQTMLLPFAGQIAHVDISLITGTSGGGRSPRDPMDHPVLTNNVRSYQINCHRHTPEITRTAQITEEQMNFTPTVAPYLRGLFATAYIQLVDNAAVEPDLSLYSDAPFIRVRDKVELTNVVSSNFCDLSYQNGANGTIIAQGATDNLLRGAAGAAVQSMNLMFGFDETEALMFTSAVYP